MGSESNPFEFQSGTRAPRGGNPIVTYVIAGVIVLGVLIFGIWLATNASNIGHRYRGDPIKISDEDLWTEFLDDEKGATKKYKENLIQVTGICSETQSVQTPAWAPSEFLEGFAVQMGKKSGTRLITEAWMIECFIPNRDKNVRIQVDKIQQGGTLTVEGFCKGKIGRPPQICIAECRIVDYKPPK